MKNFLKGIKNFYSEHRIFTILMALVIVCLVLIMTVLIQCFYVGKGKDKYGSRLEDIKQHEISSEARTDIEGKLKEEGIVTDAKVTIQGKIIYIKMTFTPEADIIEAEGIAQKSLEYFSQEDVDYYDFAFTLSKAATESTDSFLIEGSHNSHGTGFSWNLNRQVVEEPRVEE